MAKNQYCLLELCELMQKIVKWSSVDRVAELLSVEGDGAGIETFIDLKLHVRVRVDRYHGGAQRAHPEEALFSIGKFEVSQCAILPKNGQAAQRIRGKLNKQIAHELGTTVRTIKAHRQSAMEKLGVKSVAEAVSIAERLGMLAA